MRVAVIREHQYVTSEHIFTDLSTRVRNVLELLTWLLTAPSLLNSMCSDVILGVRKWPWWEY